MIMAGGTGGHVYPALAVAHDLRARDVDVFWLGTQRGLEARVVPEAGIDIEWVTIGGIKGKGLLTRLVAPIRILIAMWQAGVVIFRRRPEAVLGMGGFVAGPGGLAAWLLRVPLLIHESNAVAGLTNKWLARLASRVLVGFPGVLPGKTQRVVGNPVRADIAALPDPDKRLSGRSGPLRLLVVGGSLGAQVFNDTVPEALALMAGQEVIEVHHQSGRGKLETTLENYSSAGVEGEVDEFITDMASAYEWADLVVCRAGAMTVAELAAAGLAAILVPYPYAIYDHQTANARFLSRQDAALLIAQDSFTAQSLADMLAELASDRGKILKLSRNARVLAMTDATEQVSAACLEVMYA
jgi:UDP-N-acetylglucosamine--N-acetylmuramyl-(pentapeptide) pyrophosphoryl-undecaprenol N-acetylglucosamine transferase